jgi:periplasmic protein TonB
MLHYQDESREPSGAPAFKLAAVLGIHIALLAWLAHMSPASPIIATAMPMEVRIIEALRPALPPVAPPKPVTQSSKPALVRPAPTPNPAPVLTAKPESQPAAESFAVAPQPAARPKQEAAAPSPPAVTATPARFDAGYLQNPAPAYPSISKRMHEEGTVLLLVRVSANGEAERVQIKQGSGYARLDEVAVKTVQQWRFVPARQGAEAITASVVVPIVFRLDG